MRMAEIPAQEVRLSPRATSALDEEGVVAVTRYGRRRHIVLTEERFALLEPLLELLTEERIPAELLMTKGDIELERALAEDREPTAGEDELIEATLARLGP